MVFGDDEILSSSSNNNKDSGFLSMLLDSFWNPRKKQGATKQGTNKTRRSYALPTN